MDCTEVEPQAKADAVGGPANTRHLATQQIYTGPAVAPLEGESQKSSRMAKADAVGGARQAVKMRRSQVAIGILYGPEGARSSTTVW